MTNLDLSVLRAVARLSRTRRAVDFESIALRVSGSVEDVRASLGRLSRASLVERTTSIRLTMMGLAVAVGSGAQVARRSAAASRVARVGNLKRTATSRRAA